MKINVTVDLADFYNEYDEDGGASFSQQIKDNIAYNVKNIVWKSFEENALTAFTNQVQKQINLDKDLKIKQIIEKYFVEKELKKSYSGDKKITIESYIIDMLERDYFNNSNSNFERMVSKMIEDKTKQFSAEFKDRYDLLFASQLVSKMNSVGLLKDDVAKLLIDQNQSTNEK